MQRQDESKLTFNMAVTKLNENDTEFKKLDLRSLVLEPVIEVDEDGIQRTVLPAHFNDERLLILAEALEKNKTLTTIEILSFARCFDHCTDDGIRALGLSLRDHPTLDTAVINILYCPDNRQTLALLQCLTGSAPIEDLTIELHHDDTNLLNSLGELLSKKSSLQYFSIETCRGPRQRNNEEKLDGFIKGLGALNQLRALTIDTFRIGDSHLREIASAMQNVTSLKSLSFNNCKITKLESIFTIIKNNPQLSFLSLGGNSLKKEDINRLMTLIPQTTIRTLNLIRCGVEDSQLQKIAALLSDQKKSPITRFYFGNTNSKKVSNAFLTALQKNESLCNVGSLGNDREVEHACVVNQRKKPLREWSMTIDMMICLLGTASKGANNYFSSSSPDITYYILTFLLPNIQQGSTTTYFKLIRQNLSTRKKLIEEKKYNPTQELKKTTLENNRTVIKKWWSTTIQEDKETTRQLFVPRDKKNPKFMQAKEIIEEIEPILKLSYPTVIIPNAESVTFCLAEFPREKQIYIENLFRQLHIIYAGWPLKNTSPILELNPTTHLLTIHGITIDTLLAIIAPKKPAEQKISVEALIQCPTM